MKRILRILIDAANKGFVDAAGMRFIPCTHSNFASGASMKAKEDFWRMFAGRYRGRSTIWAYDLRNEPTVPWDNPAAQPAERSLPRVAYRFPITNQPTYPNLS